MLAALFLILMVYVFGRLLIAAISLTWGLSKILLRLVLLPIVLLALAAGGLIFAALPLLIILGLIVTFA